MRDTHPMFGGEQKKPYLVDHIQNHTSELIPTPTGETPILTPLPGIKAVIFDIYGTLLISAAGDISLAGGGHSPIDAMRGALELIGKGGFAEPALELYAQGVRAQQDRRISEGIDYPEVEIREVWSDLLYEIGAGLVDIELVATAYECGTNPIWPMPEMQECLASIKQRDLRLGIVSNAQFYTIHSFPGLVGKQLDDLGFEDAMSVFSFIERIGKPSRLLFDAMVSKLAAAGLQPEEAVFVGNDRLKDIWQAGEVGMKTVLFAGDQRSLRWRKEDERIKGIQPDAVITELSQLLEIIS
ncbi:MAG: HAD family hydrolase [Verrucomicrobiota bacterium]